MSWWTNIWTGRANEWTSGALPLPDAPMRKLVPHTSYLTINLRSIRLINVREGLTRLRPVVHAHSSLAYEGTGTAEFHVVTTPTNLKEIDAKHLDRVITETQPILGPVPYRGGTVKLEIGLFSVGADNLAAPYLDMLEGLSRAVGASFITNAALPFARPLIDGINGLGKAIGGSTLEIGLSTTFAPAEKEPIMTGGVHFVMRAKHGEVPLGDLQIDNKFHLSRKSKKDLLFPYIVFTIEQASTRPDWSRIPNILEAYEHVRRASIARAEMKQIKALVEAFELIARWSPDLLPADAEALSRKVREMAFPSGPQPKTGDVEPLPQFEGLALYS